ncbi:MAG: hypothetical protein FWH07_07230 [Oscillospiraceae bacterium]|nr:hypothetical protein [Oscillospiraceae bacterium]
MGTQFFWFYDILLAAILLGVVYMAVRIGFVKKVAGIVGVILAFTVAMGVSAPVAELVYDNWVAPGVIDKVNYTEAETLPGSAGAAFAALRNADMSQALVSGNSIAAIEAGIVTDADGSVTLDLSDVDLSQTGIADGDLSFFGLDSKFALLPVSLGKVDVSATDYSKYELEDIILARIMSHRIAERAKSNYEELEQILDNTIPGFAQAAQGGTDTVSLLIINIINNHEDSLQSVVNENIVRPTVLIPLKSLIFTIVFALVNVLVSVIAKASQIIDAIPLVGKANHFLGGMLGLVEAAVVIFMVCIAIRIIISFTGDNIIFLNSMTIEETFIFKHVYNIKFLMII